MVYVFNPSTREQRQVDLCECEASLVYRVSSGTVCYKRNTVSKNKGTNKKEIKYVPMEIVNLAHRNSQSELTTRETAWDQPRLSTHM